MLTTIADARRRLLSEDAAIIPCGAKVFTQPLEMRVSHRAGFALDDVNLFASDMALAPRSHSGVKLQHQPKGSYKASPTQEHETTSGRVPL